MKGFMRQRGASWELRVFLGRDPLTGKKRYATRTVRGGKREAQTALAEMVTETERGLTVRTTATVGELLEAWFEFATPDFSPKTVKETRGYIDRSLMPALGSRRLAKLKPADLDAFYRRLLTSGGSGGRPLAPGTVKRIHGILRRALNQGVKWGWIGISPATATTPPRVPRSDIKPPSPESLGRVLRRAEVDSPDLACYLMLAAATGARRSELIALRWTDVDLVGATVSIERESLLARMVSSRRERRLILFAACRSTRGRFQPSLINGNARSIEPRSAASTWPRTPSSSATPPMRVSRGSLTRCRGRSSVFARRRVCPMFACTTSAISSPPSC